MIAASIETTDRTIKELNAQITEAEGTREAVDRSLLSLYLLLGQSLAAKKAEVGHGGWETYLADQKINPTRAQRSLRFHKRRDELAAIAESKNVTLTDLTLTAALDALSVPRLSAQKSPQEDTITTSDDVSDAQPDLEAIESRGELIGDLVPPAWAELKALYAQIGAVKDWGRGIAVESERLAFSATFRSREEAWEKWQKKYKPALDRQTSGQNPRQGIPKPASVNNSEPDTAIANLSSDKLSGPPVAHPAGVIASAKSCDRYTPEFLWKAGLECFGVEQFDLDPASYAESPIPCKQIFTREQDGLARKWEAETLWSNFPYSDRTPDGKLQSVMGKWVEKLLAEYESGNVKSALTLVKCDCRPEWFQRLLEACTAYCFVSKAVKFECPESDVNGASFFGSVVFYFGSEVDRFFYSYCEIGQIGQVLSPGMFGE
ncbi:DNA N-6-adenine-methyltransferase [Pantanalinema sp. GBBB05]|uniref:DNA N-6-adenine-methyltransferase n=1 Tax=Pantanalinema sp. GBBB05 TaxID=2604139 RepID=UPI001DD916B3|nr:hypothetical protein [Pantanalinema sp. GBBB05]